MAYSKITYKGDGVTTVFSIPFPYLNKDFIKVIDQGDVDNQYEFINKQTIKMKNAVKKDFNLIIQRNTDVNFLINYFQNASILEGQELDTDFIQLLQAIQEIQDVLVENGKDITDFYNDINMNGFKITNLGDADLDNKKDAANVATVEKLIEKYAHGGAITEHMTVALTGQTDFKLPFKYKLGLNAVAVYVAGARQSRIHFTEVDEETIRIGEPCEGGEEVYIMISDQPATSIEVPQASRSVIGGGKLASIPQIDQGTDDKTLITPLLLNYALSKLDVGAAVDRGVLDPSIPLDNLPEGKYYILDFSDLENIPASFKGAGIMEKVIAYGGTSGGIFRIYDYSGNMAVKIKVSNNWGGWNQINENKVISNTAPNNSDGRPDGTIYYKYD